VRIRPDGVTPEDLLNRADSACYAAKDEGRNRVYFYDDKVEKHRGESRCYVRLQAALENDLLRIYQQEITPINEKQKGKHIEILIRMLDSSDGRIIPPDAFLPVAERYNLMPKIDRWVVKSTLQWFEENPAELEQLQLCTINLSGQSLTEADFLQFIQDIVSASKVSAEKICFEITETVAISNLNQARQFIDTVRDSGCKVALDDFGSGLSSYTYLKTLPVDFLKIDGSFVKDIEESEIDYAMVRSMNEVGHIMNIQTIAEYVENQNILDLLKEIGVDYAQGYHLSMPEPIENLRVGQRSQTDLNKHSA
jgi:EAL domain-containing protein (putative c-di-GMP-specific phosphodiesterase class I)